MNLANRTAKSVFCKKFEHKLPKAAYREVFHTPTGGAGTLSELGTEVDLGESGGGAWDLGDCKAP